MLQPNSKVVQGGGSSVSSLGKFWPSQYAQEFVPVGEKGLKSDKDYANESAFNQRSHILETHPK